MKAKLQQLATEDKQAKLGKFTKNQDDIRDIKDKSSDNLIEARAFNETSDNTNTTNGDTKVNEADAMKEKLEELVTDDKQVKIQQFVKREDDIRAIKDKSSKDVIEPHAFNETPDGDTNANKDTETEPDPEAMKAKLQELATEDKQAKLEKFTKNQDDIRDIKDKSSKNLIEAHAFNETNENKENEEDAMKKKLEELVTKDKNAKLEKFIKKHLKKILKL